MIPENASELLDYTSANISAASLPWLLDQVCRGIGRSITVGAGKATTCTGLPFRPLSQKVLSALTG
jgi:hypothetical protein